MIDWNFPYHALVEKMPICLIDAEILRVDVADSDQPFFVVVLL